MSRVVLTLATKVGEAAKVVKESTMSEQTSDSSNGLSESAEPSMEDILASIRKIIADDEDHGGVLDASSEPDANALDAAIAHQPDNLPDELSVNVEDVAVLNNDAVENFGETLDLEIIADSTDCLLYTSPSPRDRG